MNGPLWGRWDWIRRPHEIFIAAVFALASAPAIAAVGVIRGARARLLAVSLSAVLLQCAAISLTGVGPDERLFQVVTDAATTSYCTAAVQVIDVLERFPAAAIVRNYGRLLQFFPMHARTKPLMPVLVYLGLLRTFGGGTPLAAAMLVGFLTLATIGTAFLAGCEIWRDRDWGVNAAVLSGALLALTPSIALFFPDFDVVYPLFTCALVASWPRALRGSVSAAVCAGAVFFVLSLTSYALLTVGAFCVLLVIATLFRTGSESRRNAVVAVSVAAVAFVALNVLFSWLTGYQPLATFHAALVQQRQILPRLHRPYPATVPFDLLDFALGAGWLPVMAALLWIARRERNAVLVSGLLTPVVVALTGLVQAENARVWIFLMPFVAFAAAAELVRWRRGWQIAALATLVAVSVSLYVNVLFLSERPFHAPAPRIPTAAVARS